VIPTRDRTTEARALIERLKSLGIELFEEDGSLKFRGPRGALQPEHKTEVEALRADLMAVLPHMADFAANDVPLSFAQQRLWFLHRLDPASPQYNIGRVSRIRASIDITVFKHALHDLFQRHPAFRTRILEEEGAPRQQIMPVSVIDLEVRERPGVPEAERSGIAQALSVEMLREPLDIKSGHVGAVRVVQFAPDDHVVLLTLHHILSDGLSLDIIARDLFELYQARIERRRPALPRLTLSYADYATSERRRAELKGFAEEASFWREALADAPPLLELPTDRRRPVVASARGARIHRRIDGKAIAALRAVARAEGATLFMTILAVSQTLLARLSGQTDVIVGSPVSTREQSEYENVVGCFVNNIVLRGDLSGRPSFRDLLRQTKSHVLGAFRHASYPFDMIVEALKPQRTAAYAPVFQVLFSLLSSASAEDGEEMDETGATRFDLSIELALLADGDMKASYEYATDLFDAASIERLHQQFVLLLHAAGSDPAKSLANVSLVTGDQGLLDGTGVELAFDDRATVPSLIRAAAAATPDAVAVLSGDEKVSYRTLDQRIDALANLLATKGAGPGERVAVAMPRTTDLPAALAAVLRTGAAYIPIDPSHPRERIALILEDARPICGVAVAETALVLDGLDTVLVDAPMESGEPAAIDRPIDPHSPAYLIYTSGSTGKPKGVLVSHRNLMAFLAAMRHEPGLDAGTRLLAITTPSFDIAGLELWLPLTSQACVVLATESEVIDGDALARLIERHDVRFLQATPATWRLLLESGWQGKPDLRALCGGEAMPLDLAPELLGRVAALWNVYGPTETTIWSTMHHVTPEDFDAARIPIGRPIANTRVYVVEPGGALAPIGAPGELLIAGEGVGLGYHNLPELTTEKFAEVEAASRKERVYRTGDRARWRGDGALDFLGRSDQQVKIRGFRIELGEVEMAIVSHSDVRQAYVAPTEGPGGPTLVAYVVFEAGCAPTTSELRSHLRERLPSYMQPSLFVGIDSVPLSPNGKVDRRQLPDPYRHGRRAKRSDEPLKPGMEQTIAEIWREHLETEAVGPGDNFYELGGHSLLSLRVAAAIERRTGRRTDPRAMFFQTLRELAASAEAAGA
jgi:amino acid adenylation domain-containing protein